MQDSSRGSEEVLDIRSLVGLPHALFILSSLGLRMEVIGLSAPCPSTKLDRCDGSISDPGVEALSQPSQNKLYNLHNIC